MSLQWQLSIWLRTSDKCGACTIYLFMPQHNLFFAFNWKIGSDYTIYRNLSLTCWIRCCCVHQNVWLLFQLTCVSGDSSSIKIYMGLIYNILIYSQFLDLVRSEFSNSFLPHNFSDRIGCDSFYVESPTKEFCNIRLTQSKWSSVAISLRSFSQTTPSSNTTICDVHDMIWSNLFILVCKW